MSSRYGIAEWYGQSFMALSPAHRQRLAHTALGHHPAPQCPFRAMTCNKAGGVCAIQPYTGSNGRIAHPDGPSVIVCPGRLEDEHILVHWMAELLGFSPDAIQVAREVPFMESTVTGRAAGKIDLVVASDLGRLEWFGLEIQAVYFSGAGMEVEFEALRTDPHPIPPFPQKHRRPDWRSSSAKRLMPQLQVKGPTLRRWHSKLVVAVDAPFFQAIGGPSEHPSRDLDSGDILWLVPEVSDGQLRRGHWEVLTLEASCDKLLAAKPITRTAFERSLRKKLRAL